MSIRTTSLDDFFLSAKGKDALPEEIRRTIHMKFDRPDYLSPDARITKEEALLMLDRLLNKQRPINIELAHHVLDLYFGKSD